MPLVRKVLGTVLAAACFGVALYALFRLVQGGSCASGGNYVSTHQCPAGTGWWAAELPLGIIGGLLFLGVGYLKFGKEEPAPVTAPRPAPDLTAQMFLAGAGIDWQNATVVRMQGEETGTAPATDQDPLARLERLRALRDANALTAAEYDEAKAKILSQM
jgi:hypothetical protein